MIPPVVGGGRMLRTAPTASPPDTPDLKHLSDAVLTYQWGIAGITVAVLTIVSIVVGRWLAGRLLRPVHQIAATARRLSLSNLNERIDQPLVAPVDLKQFVPHPGKLAGPRDELTELADTFNSMPERVQRSVDSAGWGADAAADDDEFGVEHPSPHAPATAPVTTPYTPVDPCPTADSQPRVSY